MHDIYVSPLSERYASKAMLELWSPRSRYGLWRRLWLALAEAEKKLGLPIPDLGLEQMRANLDDIDFTGSVIRVRGKGKKERIVPVGEPAQPSANSST